MIYFTTSSPNILASKGLYSLNQTNHLALVTSTLRDEENMNVDAEEVLDMAVVEEEVEDVAEVEAAS